MHVLADRLEEPQIAIDLVLAVVHSPGWERVHAQFFNGAEFRASFPDVARHFLVDVKIFCVAEVAILILALGLAVIRSLPGPVFFPLRAMAIVYTDLFRGVSTIIVIFLLGFGVPGLGFTSIPDSALFCVSSIPSTFPRAFSVRSKPGLFPFRSIPCFNRSTTLISSATGSQARRLSPIPCSLACKRRRASRIGRGPSLFREKAQPTLRLFPT